MISREELLELARHRGWPSISIHLPTHRDAANREQDRLLLKNLIKAACDELVTNGMSNTEAASLCSPASKLVDDASFWREGSDGLSVFVSESGVRVLRLGMTIAQSVVVGDRFYLRPLHAVLGAQRDFYALALDKNGCRLFRANRESIDQIELTGVPASLADELKYDQREESMQFSTVPGPQSIAGNGRAQGMFHGHGGEKDVEKTDLERYLRKIERAVTKAVGPDATAPLLLMGVDYAVSTYRALNTCPAVVDLQATGATADLPPHRIHEIALETLEPHFTQGVESALAQLADKTGAGLVARSADRAVEAAASGRVRVLVFDDTPGPFGVLDRSSVTASVTCVDPPRLLRETARADTAECGWDLVDLAAAETIVHGGEVIALQGEDAAVHGVAALLRY